MYQFFLPGARKAVLGALLAIAVAGYVLTLIFRDPHPNDNEIASAYDNGVGVEASQCRRIDVSPYEGSIQSPTLTSQAPSLKAHICSFIDKRNNQVSSGVLVKSSSGKRWLAISHFATYVGRNTLPTPALSPAPTLPTEVPTLPTKPAGPQAAPSTFITHPTQQDHTPRIVSKAPSRDDTETPSSDDMQPGADNFSIGFGPTISNHMESQTEPAHPAISAHESATGDVSAQD